MTIARLACRCAPSRAAGLALTIVALAACSTSQVTPSAGPLTLSPMPSRPATPAPTPRPTPTPPPTPRFTNEADPDLAALIPATAAGASITVPAHTEFGLTPGDVGSAYGTVGDRFATLVIAFVPRPRATSLYAMRVDGAAVRTEDLEPYLPTAANFVGIAGLHREPWSLVTIDAAHVAWARPEDNATAAGTMIYTWAADEFVFLLIGVDDAINRALIAALPGEPPPTPTPAPTRTPRASGAPSRSPSASPTPSA